MQVFQMFNRQHSLFHEGKTAQIFSNEKYEKKNPYFMSENCDHVLTCEIDIFLLTVK